MKRGGVWSHWSRKLKRKITRPHFLGKLSQEKATQQCMQLIIGDAMQEGLRVRLYLLLDPADGVIADVRFLSLGPAVLVGLAEAAAELLIRKNYDQAKNIDACSIERHLADKAGQDPISAEENRYLNVVVDAIESVLMQCEGMALPDGYVATPLQEVVSGEPYPGWEELSTQQQISIIEEVIAADIRPYIELDAGGISVLQLIAGKELIIAYQGACTSCYSAVGSTLQAIEQILRAKVHPLLRVVPDRSFLSEFLQ